MADLPTVIPRTRTTTLGGQAAGSERFLVEMQTQSLADVRQMVKDITAQVTAEQMSLGNPPTLLQVDGTTGKPLEQVDKRTSVLYGTVLAGAAMREVEMDLRAAILQSTEVHSGRLADITGSWEWLYIPKGGAPRAVAAGTDLPAFAMGDQLVLVPRQVPYATITNRNVARGGSLNNMNRAHRGNVAKSRQNRGFLFWAAQSVRRRSAFKFFRVHVVFTKAHMVPNEVMTRSSGTGMIVITPRLRRGV
jgi:hypothetical protein